MTVPKSLKLTESELPSFAQLGHQLAAAARPGISMRDLLQEKGAKSDRRIGDDSRCRGGDH